ncbi:hypothetical protein F4604DRAFT_1686437 [Suillus subluteus]|nr:hypothetical protein F4604DRAFT_1686437 [Suillus subluteus]
MSEPIDHHIRFDLPMDADDESQSSHVGDTPKCGTRSTCIGAEVIKLWLDAASSISRSYGASNNTFQLWHGCTCHIAVNSIHPSNATTKANQFWLGLPSSSGIAYASAINGIHPYNAATIANQFWLGLPSSPGIAYASSAYNSNSRPTDTMPHTIEFWLDWESLIQGSASACEPAKVGSWQPFPITATVSTASPATCSSLPVSYAAPALPNTAGALQLPKAPIPAITVAMAGESQEPKLATLVSEAEQAVINMVKCLQSDEYNGIQLMHWCKS